MKDDSDSLSSVKTNRRRWEVNSRERDPFHSTLAFEASSPEKYEHQRIKNMTANTPRQISFKNDQGVHLTTQTDNVPGECNSLDEKESSPVLKTTVKNTSQETGECCNVNNIRSESPTAPPLSPTRNMMKNDNIVCSTISQHLKQINGDSIVSKNFPNESHGPIPSIAVSGISFGPSSSTLNSNVTSFYCEKFNNFSLINDEKIPVDSQATQGGGVNFDSHIAYALYMQTGFRIFSLLCQGILTGITISHCILVFILNSYSELYRYHKFDIIEHVFFALIIFLTTLCLVSAFDRCDLAGQSIFYGQGLQVQWTPLFYFISFTLSLVMVRAESFFAYFINVQDKKEEIFVWWQYMALSRTVFAVLAWTAQVANPHKDALNDLIGQPVNSH